MSSTTVKILEEEMFRARLNKRELAARLSETGKPITEQALGLWFARGKIPLSRLADLERALNSNRIRAALSESLLTAPDKLIQKRVAFSPPRDSDLSPQAQMLAEWLDKIEDPMLKLECFHACTALVMQTLRQPTPTALPAAPHQP